MVEAGSPQAEVRRHARWLWPALAILGAGALLFGLKICVELFEGENFGFDKAILLAFRTPGDLARPIGPAWLEQSALDFSALGGFTLLWVFGIAGLAFLVYLGQRAEAAWIAASLVGASLLNTGLKVWLHRPRPEVVPHLEQVANASFPSGHAMISAATYFTLAVMLAQAQPRLGVRVWIMGFFGVLVVLIGISRVYLGVHWPSDVLAGWCFGVVWALLVFAADRALTRRR